MILRNSLGKVWSPVAILISDDLAWIRWNRFACKRFLSELHIHFQISLCTEVHVLIKYVLFTCWCETLRYEIRTQRVCRAAIWRWRIKPKILINRYGMGNRRHMLPSFIEQHYWLLCSLPSECLEIPHVVFTREIAGNIRRSDYQKAHYFLLFVHPTNVVG